MPKSLIQPRHVLHNGQRVWRVLVPLALQKPGFPKRRHFGQDKAAADKFCASLEKERRNGFTKLTGYPVDVQSAIVHAIELLGDNRGKEIVPAVQLYLKNTKRERRTLKDASADCVAAKTAAGKRRRYLVALANTLKRFALGREDMHVDELSIRECEQWINGANLATATRRSRQIDLSTFFSFCVKRGYCHENPISRLELHKFDDKPPAILTVAECDTLLFFCEDQFPDMLAALALMLFAGLRPSEAYKTSWDDLRDGHIIIEGKTAKTRARRIVPINETLNAWLTHADNRGADLPPLDGQHKMARVRKVLPTWPSDALRHSFVSYHYALHGEVETSKQAGHSIDILLKHYRSLVTKTDAESFWKLRPETI